MKVTAGPARREGAGEATGALRLRRPPATALAGAVVCGLAAWATAGRLAVTAGDVSSRVALLAPWWAGAAVMAGLVLLGAVVRVPPRAWRPTLLPAVLLLPWLPIPVPDACLLWVGPIAAWVWAGTAIAVACAWWGVRADGRPNAASMGVPRRLSLAVVAAGFAVYAAGAGMAWRMLPAGDAPHYLVITQSLLLDHDLRIENNHKHEDYAAYYTADLRPDYLRRGRNGQIYSIHAPGLPALVAPAFAAGGYPAVVFFLAFVASLGAWLVWRTALLLTGSAGAAWFGWASVSLSAPFFLHAFQVFPDATGAVVTMTGVAALAALDPRGNSAGPGAPGASLAGWWFGRLRGERGASAAAWLAHGAALAALPWLHTRYAAIAVVLGACLVVRLAGGRRFRDVAAFGAIPVVSAAAWFSYFYVIYGTFSPAAPYGSYTQSSAANIPTALPALFFDQQFGVVPNAPVYLAALAGLVLMFNRRRRLAIELALVAFAYLAAVASYSMWWGGWSAPARFAVPVLLILGLPAADFWARRGPAARAAGLTLLVVSCCISVTFVTAEGGRLIFNSRDGFSRWIDWVAPLVDLPRAVPSFLRAGAAPAWEQTAAWAFVLGIGYLAIRALGARVPETEPVRRRAVLAVAAPAIFAVSVMAAATISWAVPGAEPLTPATAQLRLVRDASRRGWPAALQYRPLRVVAAGDLLPRLHAETSTRRAPGPRVPLLATSVPAATYRIRAAAGVPVAGGVAITIGRSTRPLERCPAERIRAGECWLRLPVETSAVAVTADANADGRAPTLQLQPLSALPEPPRPEPAGPAVPGSGSEGPVSRATRYAGAAVFTFDELVYLEERGFWMTGGRDDLVIISPDPPARRVSLLVRNGAHANTVTLRTASWTMRLRLAPGEERFVDVPVDARSGAVALRVHPEQGFRPADMQPGNRDFRYLGAWLELPGGAS